ncbi:type VII secretion system-associated protein [Streptomyces sp. NPDC005811]|uniref:type VII secretion system-associated protein n=1 Tax=Streptomyces sp. NPDC005811 TaxID=3154565 RepID=UPI00340ED732
MSDFTPPENLAGDASAASADTLARSLGDPESPSAPEADGEGLPQALSWPVESAEPTPDSAPEPGAMPSAPDHIVDAALLAPDHWFGLVDAAWRGTWPPPMWAVVGQWRSDAAGRLVEWQSNPEYIPSPSARGWARPTDPIDAAVQRAASGYGEENEVPVLVARAEVAVYVRPDGELVTAVAPDGSAVVPVLTSQFQVNRAGRLAYEVHPVLELMEWVPTEHALYLNPAAEVSMRLDPEALEQALAVVRDEIAAEDEAAGAQDTPADAADRDAGPFAEEADRRDDEPVAGATRIETSGSAPAPVVLQRAAFDSDGSAQTAPGAPDINDAFGTERRAAAEGVGGDSPTPAAVSQAADHAGSPAANLAEGAAAALMGMSDR